MSIEVYFGVNNLRFFPRQAEKNGIYAATVAGYADC